MSVHEFRRQAGTVPGFILEGSADAGRYSRPGTTLSLLHISHVTHEQQ